MKLTSFAIVAGLVALGGPASAQTALPQSGDHYFQSGQGELQALIAAQPNTRRAKNIILFIGDGMSIPTITAARIYDGQQKGVDGESNVLAFERLLPWTALSKTYTDDFQVADSAATATAMTTGIKVRNGTLGVNANARVNDCATQTGNEVTTIFEQAEDAGLATGIVSTARITHATPASAYAHTVGRDWEADSDIPKKAAACKDIASQLVAWPHGDGFEVMLGGGRAAFYPTTVSDVEYPKMHGARKDGRDLVAEWQAEHGDGEYVWNLEQFNAVKPGTNHLLGLFQPSHMRFESERNRDTGGEPSLAEMTTEAIKLLSRNDKGFVLMVEGGRIDMAHHIGNAARALDDTVALSAAVEAAYDAVDPEETLIVLTADHSHVMTISGYPKRNNPILGIGGIGKDGKPYTTLGYMNGPSGLMPDDDRSDVTGVDTSDIDYRQQALVPLADESHGGDDVVIFAHGPWAHLFHGVVEQNVIYHVMAKAIGLAGSAP